jgi:hypothetical protein
LTLEAPLVGDGRADEHLPHHRHALTRQGPAGAGIHRNIAPTDQTLARREDLVFDDLFAAPALFTVLRQEHEADAILPWLRQMDVERLALLFEKLVG